MKTKEIIKVLPYIEPEHENKYYTHVQGDGHTPNQCNSCLDIFYARYSSKMCDKCKTNNI